MSMFCGPMGAQCLEIMGNCTVLFSMIFEHQKTSHFHPFPHLQVDGANFALWIGVRNGVPENHMVQFLQGAVIADHLNVEGLQQDATAEANLFCGSCCLSGNINKSYI